MTIICGERAIAIKRAEREGKRVIFVDFDNSHYYTKEYFGENIAHAVLNDLAIDGFKRVDKLYAYEPGMEGVYGSL